MNKSYMQHELLKHRGTLAEGRIWCVWIISDQYIEFSGNMVPNYAPVWPRAHLFSHLFVFFSLQALLPSHSSSVRALWPAHRATIQAQCKSMGSHISTQTHGRQGTGFETSNPITSSPAGWSIVRKKALTAPPYSLHLSHSSLIILSMLSLSFLPIFFCSREESLFPKAP